MISFYSKESSESFCLILTHSSIITLDLSLESLSTLMYFHKGFLEQCANPLFSRSCRLCSLLLTKDLLSLYNLKNTTSGSKNWQVRADQQEDGFLIFKWIIKIQNSLCYLNGKIIITVYDLQWVMVKIMRILIWTSQLFAFWPCLRESLRLTHHQLKCVTNHTFVPYLLVMWSIWNNLCESIVLVQLGMLLWWITITVVSIYIILLTVVWHKQTLLSSQFYG
jgi:hypothetical protein